jgi:hypothetical protein
MNPDILSVWEIIQAKALRNRYSWAATCRGGSAAPAAKNGGRLKQGGLASPAAHGCALLCLTRDGMESAQARCWVARW